MKSFEGKVFTGKGEGADYIGMEPYQKKINRITGFKPFPGTLNLFVDEEKAEKLRENFEPEVIEEFSYEGQNCSRLEVYEITVDGLEAAFIDIEITDHGGDVIEIVAPEYLRDRLDLEDEDKVTVELQKE